VVLKNAPAQPLLLDQMNNASPTDKKLPPTATLNQRTVLLNVNSVMDVRGVSADAVYNMADELQWVWNVAVDPAAKIRNLRFWVREVITPETTRNLNLATVLALILGERKNFQAGEVCHLLRVRRPTLLNLRRQLSGKMQTCGGAIFPREGLFNFLKARWIGCGASKTPATAVSATLARPGGNKSPLPVREARQIDFRKRANPSKRP
jgi:hypothetical protein